MRRFFIMCAGLIVLILGTEQEVRAQSSSGRIVSISRQFTFDSGNPNAATAFLRVEGTKNILLRAVGPTLSAFGLAGVLADPKLTVLATNGDVLATNSGWANNAAIASVSQQVGAFGLISGSADAALLISLPAGVYAVTITSAGGISSGIVLGEIYEVDQTGKIGYVALLNSAWIQPANVGLTVGSGTSLLARMLGPGLSNPNGLSSTSLTALGNGSNVLTPVSSGLFATQFAAAAAGDFNLPNFNGSDAAALYADLSGPMTFSAGAASNATGSVGLYECSLVDAQRPNFAPGLIVNPQALGHYEVGAVVSLSVVAVGLPLPSYQWQKEGVDIPGATGSVFTIGTASSSDSGNYRVVVTNSVASAISPSTFAQVGTPVVTAPIISLQPNSATVVAGAATTLSVTASSGNGTDSYQWYFKGKSIAGATAASLSLKAVAPGQAGDYYVVVSNSAGSVTSATVTVSVLFSRIVNLSIKAVASNTAPLTVGYVVGGAGASGTMPALLRATGPALAQFGVPAFLADPALAVHSGSNVISSNDNWGTNVDAITAADLSVGAFALTDSSSKDAALISAFSSGNYSMTVSDASGGSGTTLAEVYDASTIAGPALPRLINVSSLTQVGGDNASLSAGFVIQGNTPKTVLIRGIGPSLKLFGVADAISQLTLTLFAANGSTLKTNSAWGGGTELTQAFSQVQAFPLAGDSADAALLTVLNPGLYTVEVKPAAGMAGGALVEVYDVE